MVTTPVTWDITALSVEDALDGSGCTDETKSFTDKPHRV